jgi:O-antigen/teichoic acid export membrane protein
MSKPGSLARNIGLNFFGLAAPLVVGLVCIPGTIKGLGVAPFGLLSIAWVLIGYISIFDLGLGRALTHAIAQRLGLGRAHEIRALVGRTAQFMLLLSLAGAALIAVISPWAGTIMTKGRPDLTEQARNMFLIVALGMPAVILSNGARGALEAYERFGNVSIVRALTGISTYLVPYVALTMTHRVDVIVLALVVGRYIGTAAFAISLAREPDLKTGDRAIAGGGVGELLRFGGWMTVSNTVSPLMTNMDRFLVSSVTGVAQVAYYTTPFDMVTRLFVIPEAVFGVLFPRMTRSLHGDGQEAERLYQLSLKILGGLMFAVSIAFIGGGHLFLTLWLNPDFATKSGLIMSLLSIGMFLNSVARPPFNLVQARGRSDLTAKLHLVELPLYFGLVFGALHLFGVMGAAIAWLVRIALDFVLLSLIAKGRTTAPRLMMIEIGLPLLFGAVLVAVALIPSPWPRAIVSAVVLLAALMVFVFKIVTKDERGACLQVVSGMLRPGALSAAK